MSRADSRPKYPDLMIVIEIQGCGASRAAGGLVPVHEKIVSSVPIKQRP